MNEKNDSEFIENIKKAIHYLMNRQLGSCLVLSSYKVASVLKDRFGTDVNISKLGRFISKFAKENNLERLSTNVPKFKIEKSKFSEIKFDFTTTHVE
ncbi:MAG: hypothetical protein ACTSRA_12620 [Promethearchaeota archaeon]